MVEFSPGRVAELPNATEEQRKAIARVVSAIKAARGLEFDDIYHRAVGSLRGQSDDEKNLGKGSIAKWKAAKLFRWIVEHHLELGCHIAPEVFDPSLLTRWWDFVARHADYDCLNYQLAGGMGLTGRAAAQPIADEPIKMGAEYLLSLEAGVGGDLLALEIMDGNTYPLTLHPDRSSIVLPIKAGTHVLPSSADGQPDPLSELVHKLPRSYILIIAHSDIISECAKGLVSGHPTSPDKLDQIAFSFEDVDPALFEVHRLNVLFTAA